MSTSNRDSFDLPGQQAKVTPTGATNRARLARLNGYLSGLPRYDFTEKGRANICRRFRVSNDELAAAVAGLQSPRPRQPTPELLRTIAKAISHHTSEGASKC